MHSQNRKQHHVVKQLEQLKRSMKQPLGVAFRGILQYIYLLHAWEQNGCIFNLPQDLRATN